MTVPDLSCLVLPDRAPAEFLARVRDAEQAGARTVWTYDHLSWRDLADGPWFSTVPLLAAAAGATSTVRLGAQVATPNFRHPVPFAKEVMTLDHMAAGRLELGVGAGAEDADARVLGQAPLTRKERSNRFEEWATLLATLLEQDRTTSRGSFYSAEDARMIPGCVQQPRVPLTVAATGPRSMRLAALLGSAWVTYGPYRQSPGPQEWLAAIAEQNKSLGKVIAEVAPGKQIRRIAQVALDEARPFGDADTYRQFAEDVAAAGFDELTVHWPRPDGRGVPAAAIDMVVATHA
ncbi:LLM class flavin-dependent oxidoreductase [Streptomyces acidicola]|uniref:LLM class flavin-dependent oxidoreductase n=1 Tax=Streptomyces acidicola TaxID=2596892 RepID=A0A5N8WN71_9ACTN|nr:LLM class flavin-dependent oxidoreductase [Streptomyces acidicola]MPY48890.1 LLM class flavin-dependent oxidoreductase [Streptomyces acidicola]